MNEILSLSPSNPFELEKLEPNFAQTRSSRETCAKSKAKVDGRIVKFNLMTLDDVG